LTIVVKQEVLLGQMIPISCIGIINKLTGWEIGTKKQVNMIILTTTT
jgi:hypothetical protein